jgi:16S rRNA C1402 (ribose-2'-O) methylase RsmI
MYLTLTQEGVSKVERGNITATYELTSTIEEVYNGTAKEVPSDKVGDRVKSTQLVKLYQHGDEYKIEDTMSGQQSTTLPKTAQLQQLKQTATNQLLL